MKALPGKNLVPIQRTVAVKALPGAGADLQVKVYVKQAVSLLRFK